MSYVILPLPSLLPRCCPGSPRTWCSCIASALLLLTIVCPRTASADEPFEPFHPEAVVPFAASRAIVDLDADGAPDLATAERLQTRDRSRYRLNIHLAGGPAQRLTFVANQDAIDVAAVDIDNDRDLDVVVRPIFSNDVVGIWVNDGAGQFTRGSPSHVRLMRIALQPATLNGGLVGTLAGKLSRNRLSHPSPDTPSASNAGDTGTALAQPFDRLTNAFRCAASPRAPPAPPVSSIV